MFKSKICGFAIAFMIGCVSISPVNAYAAETNSESVTLSENNKDQKDQRTAFEDVLNKANEKWSTLTDKQKAEVYALLEKEMKAEFKLMDKLVEFGVFQKEDAAYIKTRMNEKLNEIKQNGVFPLAMPKRNKKQ